MAGKIRYLVDEYQDTNTSQYELIKLLVGDRACFTVVAMMTNLFIRGVAHDQKIWCVYADDFPRLNVIKLEQITFNPTYFALCQYFD